MKYLVIVFFGLILTISCKKNITERIADTIHKPIDVQYDILGKYNSEDGIGTMDVTFDFDKELYIFSINYQFKDGDAAFDGGIVKFETISPDFTKEHWEGTMKSIECTLNKIEKGYSYKTSIMYPSISDIKDSTDSTQMESLPESKETYDVIFIKQK